MGSVPLAAMFVLFDFVVHNPHHHETTTNLALLDVAAGYFSRLDYATGSALPSSQLSGFSHLASQFVLDSRSTTPDPPAITVATSAYNTDTLAIPMPSSVSYSRLSNDSLHDSSKWWPSLSPFTSSKPD
jgi:hypothetical protein